MRRFVTVDVFTDQPFGGNPLAVLPEASGLSTEAMQRIAREFNYSETSFVLPPADPAHHAQVRIFTPEQELPFAGHPNVGTAFVLALDLLGRGQTPPERFLFEEQAGLVPVRVLRDGDAVIGAELTAPKVFGAGGRFEATTVADALGLPADSVRSDAHPPLLGSAGLPFLLVELDDADTVDRATIRAEPIAALLAGPGSDQPGDQGRHAAGIYLYAHVAPGRAHARMFGPLNGINEDPATGSAAAALGGLLGTLNFPASIEIRQGVAMGRPSRLQVTRSADNRISVAGRCVAMMSGALAHG